MIRSDWAHPLRYCYVWQRTAVLYTAPCGSCVLVIRPCFFHHDLGFSSMTRVSEFLFLKSVFSTLCSSGGHSKLGHPKWEAPQLQIFWNLVHGYLSLFQTQSTLFGENWTPESGRYLRDAMELHLILTVRLQKVMFIRNSLEQLFSNSTR